VLAGDDGATQCGYGAGRGVTQGEAPLVLAGKYRVLRRIGAGGMGVVLAVENVRTGGLFALKVLRRATVPDEMVRRFVLEARAAVRVKHPNVVQVFDLEDDPETASLYIVQELLEGETLGARLRRGGALALDDALAIAEPLMEALALAHGMDVVHRDLKPENVILVAAPGGRCVPKLIDFGIAKLLDRGAGSILTAEGMIGTPA
jgi:serine/threonine-protein kinase